EQGAERVGVLERVVRLLSLIDLGWESRGTMLRAGQEERADVLRQRHVALAIGAGMNQRRGSTTAPIFNRRVRKKDLRLVAARAFVVEQPLVDAADWIALRRRRKREGGDLVHRQRGWFGAAQIHAETRATGDMRHHAIEHLPALLIVVEAVIEERSQEPATLRRAERNRFRRTRQRVRRVP